MVRSLASRSAIKCRGGAKKFYGVRPCHIVVATDRDPRRALSPSPGRVVPVHFRLAEVHVLASGMEIDAAVVWVCGFVEKRSHLNPPWRQARPAAIEDMRSIQALY